MGDFFYIVTDDSMSIDRILRGDVVRIRETQNITLGDIVAIACQDNISLLTLRKVDQHGLFYNVDFSDSSRESRSQVECLIVGKVIKHSMDA